VLLHRDLLPVTARQESPVVKMALDEEMRREQS
jgi:hypothetical protein